MKQSNTSVVISHIIEIIESILGWIGIVMWGICIITEIVNPVTETAGEKSGFIITCVILTGISFILVYSGRKRKKLRLKFKKYTAALSANPQGLLTELAAADGASVEEVTKNLDEMIRKKFFPTAYIDRAANRLVIPDFTPNAGGTNAGTNASPQTSAPKVEYLTCNCKNCGGVNRVVKGAAAECEFCGSPIQS